jgi:hypothetical protein
MENSLQSQFNTPGDTIFQKLQNRMGKIPKGKKKTIRLVRMPRTYYHRVQKVMIVNQKINK